MSSGVGPGQQQQHGGQQPAATDPRKATAAALAAAAAAANRGGAALPPDQQQQQQPQDFDSWRHQQHQVREMPKLYFSFQSPTDSLFISNSVTHYFCLKSFPLGIVHL